MLLDKSKKDLKPEHHSYFILFGGPMLKFRFILITLLLPSLTNALKKSDFKIEDGLKTIEVASGGSKDLNLKVYVPKGEHIYVKHVSTLSFNILTSFKVPEKSGFGLEYEAPKGEQKDNDIILKGKGRSTPAGVYKLTFFETLGRKTGNRTYRVKLQIETQSCDTKSNVCYRPQKFTQRLRFKVNEEKLVIKHRSTSNIKWVTKYDEAYSQARSKKQNVFVVITAPTWCGYCIRMERNVFPKKNVENILNDKFVALRLTDTNPDRRKFRFRGYPTMLVTNENKRELTRRVGRSADGLVASLQPYAKSSNNDSSSNDNDDIKIPVITTDDNSSDEKYTFSLSLKGLFKNTGNGNWVSVVNGKQEQYKEIRRDTRYIVIKHKRRKEYIALPVSKNQAYTFVNGKWKPYFKVRK